MTYRGEGCHDPSLLRSDVAGFFRRLRAERGGDPFPYVWVPEWHKTDHGLHAHFAVHGRVSKSAVEALWGNGFVYVSPPPDDGPATSLEQARRTGRYLSKYVSKTFEHSELNGRHRYEVAQGFQPQATSVYGRTVGEALAAAGELMGGGQPDYVWDSGEDATWDAPPSVFASWVSSSAVAS